MRVLALSTASPALSLALFDGGKLVAHRHEIIGRGHAEALMPAIAALFDDGRGAKNSDAIIVDIGPGSFTGIRIGIAAARALGLAWSVPVTGCTGAALVAARAFALAPTLAAVTVFLDAGRGQILRQVIAADFSAGPIDTIATITLASGEAAAGAMAPAGAVHHGQPDAADALRLPLSAATLRHARFTYGRPTPCCRCEPRVIDRRLWDCLHEYPLLSTLAGPVVAAADERHLDVLMDVMRASFDAAYGEAWSALQLAGTLGQPNSFARQAIHDHGAAAAGFTLCRSAGPEVELLLIAVRPQQRGVGVGQLLLDAACTDAFRRGASEIFLEVRENNLPARALYRKTGFVDVGRRADYYAGSFGDHYAAITMRRQLDDLT